MNIGDKEYREKLKQYFEEVGPNTGTNMASKWAWSITQEKAFRKTLKERNIEVGKEHIKSNN
jgi:hypothetical protein